MGEILMENNYLSEKEKEEILEKTIILEENTIVSESKPNKKLKINIERFGDKQNNKPKIKIEKYNLLISVLLALLILTVLYGIISIRSSLGVTKEQKWEYKTVTVTPSTKSNRMGTGAGDFSIIEQSEEQLNELGADGWELVSSYLELETAFPNFGDQKYVTGIQPNVRPQDVVLLFKRPVKVK